MKAVIAENLVKTYGTKKVVIEALKDVSFEVEPGELFGIIGPDGAGKTSLFRILTTLLLADKGNASVDGLDVVNDFKSIRKRVGYMPGRFSLYQDLTVLENLEFFATIFETSIEENYDLVKDIYSQIEPFKDRKAGKLSGGMKRRLGIAQALIGDPRLLVIDEPTTGLDPEERIRFRNILSDLSQRDVTIILSTHIVGDISSTCYNMAMLNKGEVAFEGSPEAMVDQVRGHVWQVILDDEEFTAIKVRYPVISTIPVEGKWEVTLISTHAPHPAARNASPNLEHAYVYFMEHQLGVSLV